MEDVLDAIRRIIARWVVTTTPLISDAHAGDTQIKVRTSRRFAPGDEFLIKATAANGTEEVENRLVVSAIIDKNTIQLTEPLQWSWPVSEDAAIIKTINDDFVRAVYIGEPSVIQQTSLPAVTVNGISRNSEWYTIRATKERFELEISVFVNSSTQEDGVRLMYKIADIIQHGLKQNIYPLVNSYDQTALLVDALAGDCFIKVADSSIFQPFSFIYFEDPYNAQENTVNEIIDSTTIRIARKMDFDFFASDTKVVLPHRFVYNSWPSSIKYGSINKGTLLKSAVISYFVEETEIQGDGGWHDTNLT
jgi:hypothetical protein